MVRTVYERMNLRESETITPQDLINSRLVTTVINTFFGTSQLSQFGDQTNPLAEITQREEYLHLDQAVFLEKELVLKLEMFTIPIMGDCVLSKHLKVLILD
ncbi:MAG: hypothetical protein Ct9H300mP24_1250 [Candidatus Neomarinimicrobiota bacterium]|nr:MAG: hypothetical protein Ct9H300mP24_1250 [Candidatus Neomarinimicrobiota bacterium]